MILQSLVQLFNKNGKYWLFIHYNCSGETLLERTDRLKQYLILPHSI